MTSAAVAVYIPLVLSFFTQKQFYGVKKPCHTQLYYRSDMAVPGVPNAVFSCNEPITAPLAEVLPFYAELQTDTDNGVFNDKVKIFSATQSEPNVWVKTYYGVNPTTFLLETTEDPNNASILMMVTEPDSELHSPGGRFHLEYHHTNYTDIQRTQNRGTVAANYSECANGSVNKLRLCAKLSSSDGMNYCGPYHLTAAENCDALHSRTITGLLTPFYQYPMKQCHTYRFD